MATGIPGKILSGIEKDVKKEAKALRHPWPGFGPVAEGHLSPDTNKAIVVWRQGSNEAGFRTSFMIGTYIKNADGWCRQGVVAANYDKSMPANDIDTIVKKTKDSWKIPEAA